MKKFTLVLLPVTLLLLVFAFRSREISVTLTGKVTSSGQPLPSAFVVVDKGDGVSVPYDEPTLPSGSYRLRFNAVEGKRIQLLFKKDGYSTLRREFVADANFRNQEIPAVTLLQLRKDGISSLSAYNCFRVYKDRSLQEHQCFGFNQIRYFNMIEKQASTSAFLQNGQQTDIYLVNFNIDGSADPVIGWYVDQVSK